MLAFDTSACKCGVRFSPGRSAARVPGWQNAKNAEVTAFLNGSVYLKRLKGALYGKPRCDTRLPRCAGI